MAADFLERKRQAFNHLKALIEARITKEQADPDNPLYVKSPTTWSFQDISGWSLINLAIVLGDLDTVKDLVENKKISISQPMRYGDSAPLEIALSYNKIPIAEYLLNQGADITDCMRTCISPGPELEFYDERLKAKLQAQKTKDLSTLTQPSPITGKSLLDYAAELGDIETLKAFNAHDKLATIYNKNPNNNTNLLLHRAIANNQYETVKFLLENNVALDQLDKLRRTPLHVAAGLADNNIIELLLNHGAGINALSISGWTPLFTAIYKGRLNAVNFLKDKGADPNIKTYLGETIFHAAAYNDIDLAAFFTDSNFVALKSQKNIFQESPEAYRKETSIGLEQSTMIDKFTYYCELFYRDKSYLSNDGYCNGLVFLFQYYDSIKKLEDFFAIIKTIANWDGTISALQSNPDASLNYRTIGEVFEEFLYFATFFQMSCIGDMPVNQKDRTRQMELLKLTLNLTMACKDYSLTREKFLEILNIFQKCPANMRVEIGGFGHVTTLKKETDASLTYFDCNFSKRLSSIKDAADLCDIILNTKYHGMDHQNTLKGTTAEVNYAIRLMLYHFPWDKYPEDFNYFTDDELPKSEAEVKAFQAKSANSFSPLHIAIMTKSKRNFQKLLTSNVCTIDESVLQLAYVCADKEMIAALLGRAMQWDDPDRFRGLSYQDELAFIDKMIQMPNSKHLHHYLDFAVFEENIELLNKLFAHKKIDLQSTVERVISFLNYSDVSDAVKQILYKHYKDIFNPDGQRLMHLAVAHGKSTCVTFLMKQDPNLLNAKNTQNKSALHVLISQRTKQNDAAILAKQQQLLVMILANLPSTISLQDAGDLLSTLSNIGEPLLSQYADKICTSVDVNKTLGSSIFRYTLLHTFANRLDDGITLTLLKHMDYHAINYQDHQTKNTALHRALDFIPKNAVERQKLYKIIEALLIKTDLSLKNREGFSCQELIENHFDPKIKGYLSRIDLRPQIISVAA